MAEAVRRRRAALILSALAGWAVGVAALLPAHGTMLNWDEVLYVDAGRLGLWANLTDAGSLSPAAFYRFGLDKWRGRTPQLPPDYDEERDPLLLRCYHPPFVALPLIAVASSSDDRILRLPLLLGGLVLSAALLWAYACYRRLDAATPMTAAGLLAMAVLAGWSMRLLFAAWHSHGWMSVWTLVTASALVLWLDAPSRRRGLLVCASLALGLATLQSAVPVWAAVAFVVLAWRRGLRVVAAGGLVALALTLLLWPGLLLHASLVKMYAYYYYIARLGEEHARRWQVLPHVLEGVLPLVVGAPLALVALARRWPVRWWAPPLLLALAYAAPVALFAIVPYYLMPALVPLAPLVGAAVDTARRPLRWAGCAGLLLLAALSWRATPFPGDADRRAELEWLRGALAGRTVLADGGHIYRHYLGPSYTIEPLTVSWDGGQLLLRERGAYRVAGVDDLRGTLVVVRRYRKRSYAEDVSAAPLASCRRIDRPSIMVFDCAAGARP